ncbi:MAG: hypothetical protein ONB44_01590 [candidate division KSB1 bacterium]|nr:hypothetical protein [candidate division KSB1 bacterium]MDZ7300813.1 hypothetical protein [candidate division KSB1 bacterium]MDZ7309916.1 hypothetical protein [candidate division KSB1 bacterium]
MSTGRDGRGNIGGTIEIASSTIPQLVTPLILSREFSSSIGSAAPGGESEVRSLTGAARAPICLEQKF